MKHSLKFFIGFLLLFTLYHFAEYFVLFTYQPLAFLLVQLIFFVVAWAIAKWQGLPGMEAWGLGFKAGWLKQLAAGLVFGVVLYGGAFTVNLLLRSEAVVTIPPVATLIQPLLLFFIGNFFSSFSEDILTRGYLYRHFGSRKSAPLFILLSSVVYVLNHIHRLADGWQTILYLFILGVLLVIPLLTTKRLWLTGGMHWMGNTVFYFTHSLLETKATGGLQPNTIFVFWMLLLIPLEILLIRLLKLTASTTLK